MTIDDDYELGLKVLLCTQAFIWAAFLALLIGVVG